MNKNISLHEQYRENTHKGVEPCRQAGIETIGKSLIQHKQKNKTTEQTASKHYLWIHWLKIMFEKQEKWKLST